MSKAIHVLVTGVEGGGVGGRIVQSLQFAKDTNYTIVQSDMNPESSLVRKMPAANADEYLDSIDSLIRRDGIQAVFPGSNPELLRLAKHRQVIEDAGALLMANTYEIINMCNNKWQTYQFLDSHGFKTPASAIDDSILKFPMLLKPYLDSGGSKNTYIARNEKDREFFTRYMTEQGVKVIAQEYVGSPDEEYTVGVLHSLDGDFMGSIAVKRHVKGALHTRMAVDGCVVSSGVSHGDVGDYPIVCENAVKIAEKLKSKGPLNIQCRKVGDEAYTFEINPRFSGTESIRARLGYNAPDALVKLHILGEKDVDMSYRHGTVLRRIEDYEI